MRFKLTLVFGTLPALILLLLPFLLPLSGNPGSDTAAAIGRFHILVLHFPIALLLIVPVLELLSRFNGMKYLREAGMVILALCLLFGTAACILGYLLALAEGGSGELLSQHMRGGIAATILIALTLVLKVTQLDRPYAGSGVLYLSALLLSIAVLSVGSHHGASMVHGEDYLFAKLPPSFRVLFSGSEADTDGITADASAYDRIIQPIFEKHCYLCHSEAKEKGGFRMDDFELLLAGGDGGMPGIEPGSLEDSEVHYRITLDPTSNAFMPPNGRDPLTQDEIALISWWIASGASATASIAELDHPPEALGALLSGHQKEPPPAVPAMDADTFARISSIAKEQFGIDVIPESQNLADGAYVAARNARTELTVSAFSLLKPLAPHISSINLWRCTLNDDAFSALAKFQALENLNLQETNVTREKLAQLRQLKHLKILNLHSTQIDDSSVPVLIKFQALEKLLINNTGISTNGVAQLQKALPKCEILATMPAVEPHSGNIEKEENNK